MPRAVRPRRGESVAEVLFGAWLLSYSAIDICAIRIKGCDVSTVRLRLNTQFIFGLQSARNRHRAMGKGQGIRKPLCFHTGLDRTLSRIGMSSPSFATDSLAISEREPYASQWRT